MHDKSACRSSESDIGKFNRMSGECYFWFDCVRSTFCELIKDRVRKYVSRRSRVEMARPKLSWAEHVRDPCTCTFAHTYAGRTRVCSRDVLLQLAAQGVHQLEVSDRCHSVWNTNSTECSCLFVYNTLARSIDTPRYYSTEIVNYI